MNHAIDIFSLHFCFCLVLFYFIHFSALYLNSSDFFVCLPSSNSLATLQNGLLINVKQSNIVIHVLTNKT